MRIFNEDKTQELNAQELDFEQGYLKRDKRVTVHHEAIPFRKGKTAAQIAEELKTQDIGIEIGFDGNLYKILQAEERGGFIVELIAAEPDTPAQEAWDEYEDIQVYVPYTEEEIKERARRKRHAVLKEELKKIKEDIEQEMFGLVRDDYAEKKARAAEIVNELRVLEGKEPREVSA